MKSAAIFLLLVVVAGCSTAPKTRVAGAPVAQESDHSIEGHFDGDTVDIALGKFRDDYFKDQKGRTKLPHHGFTKTSETEHAARVQFYVYHESWGYDEDLILEKKDGKWLVVRRENYRTLELQK